MGMDGIIVLVVSPLFPLLPLPPLSAPGIPKPGREGRGPRPPLYCLPLSSATDLLKYIHCTWYKGSFRRGPFRILKEFPPR